MSSASSTTSGAITMQHLLRRCSAALLLLAASLLVAACDEEPLPPTIVEEEPPPVSSDLEDADPGVQSFGGVVLDAVTGQPVPDAVISTTPVSEVLRTNSRGEYLIFQNIAEGSYEVRAEREGYAPGWASIFVLQDRFQVADLLMLPEEVASVLQVTPGALRFPPTRRTATIFVENPGDAPLEWSIEELPAWLELNTTSRQVALGSPELIEVRVKPEALPEEGAAGLIKLLDSDARRLFIPVTAEPPGVDALQLTVEGPDTLQADLNDTLAPSFRLTWGADKTPVAGEQLTCVVTDTDDNGLAVALTLSAVTDHEGIATCTFRPEEGMDAPDAPLVLEVEAYLPHLGGVAPAVVTVTVSP